MARLRFLLLLLPLLSAVSVAARDLWDIDCGSNATFTSPQTNLTYDTDAGYVRTGENHVVADLTDVPHVYTTLRAFPRNKKNCYTIPDIEEGVKVLVRIWFYYGNYDRKAKPPQFQVHFDSTPVCLMTTTMDEVFRCEAVYRAKRNGTSICFARMADDQDPFVSVIQVRRLLPDMYGALDYSKNFLNWFKTYAFGATAYTRYPNDRYDRVWEPVTEGYTSLNNTAVAVNTTGLSDRPPQNIFATAAAPPRGATNLTIATPWADPFADQLYVNMYFTEVSNLTGSAGTRAFHIYKDGEPISSGPVVPPFGRVLELTGIVNATNNTVFELVPTNASTLPPIISAMEVFRVGTPNNFTSNADVATLSLLQSKFKVLRDWAGDPCLPKGFNWEWVRCNMEASPRVTKLLLSGFGLSGNLPDFSALNALETIDLQNNKLIGEIPEFFGKLTNLEVLNLADNNFSSVPSSLSNTSILVNITGNPLLCNKDQYCFFPSSPGRPASPLGNSSLSSPPSGSNKITMHVALLYFVIVFVIGMVH